MKKNACPSCNGKGHKWDYYRDCVRKCCDCDGSGELDWIEQIFGKQSELKWFMNYENPHLDSEVIGRFKEIVESSINIPSKILKSNFGTNIKDLLFKGEK